MADKITVYIDPDLEDLVPRYLQGKARELGEIRRALASEDFETIRILGHSMKGTGGGYGFEFISLAGNVLEKAAGARDKAAIERQLDLLADYLDRVEVVYRAN